MARQTSRSTLTMDYEKKYNEALERAKKIDKDIPGCLQNIFPELRESENERIIIGFIRHLLFEHAFEHGGVDVNGDYCKDEYEQAEAFLKSLRPQPKAEWNEEDEKRVSRIISFIIKYRRGDTDEIYQQEQDAHWLLDLRNRYAWKPSKGQSEKSKKDCNGCPHCVDRKDQYGWHFKGCIGGPYNGKFIAEIDECPLKQEQPNKDLEEAAKKYADSIAQSNSSLCLYCKDDFIAGAKWQEEKCKGCYDRDETFYKGMKYAKEQMMNDAIEGELYRDGDCLTIDLDMEKLGYTEDDKVKIIIVKEDEQ